MRAYDVVIATCWLLFFIVWAVLAMVDGGGGRRSTLLGRAVRLLLIVGIALAISYHDRLPVGAFGPATIDAAAATGAAAAGSVLCVIGLAFCSELARAVNVASMPDLHDEHDELVIQYLVHDAIHALANPVSLEAGQLLAA